MHNFMAYVIGIRDRDFTTTFNRPHRQDDTHFVDDGWLVCWHKLKHISLPFFSYAHNGIRFYIGWRLGGMLGIRLTLNNEKK